MTVVCNGEILKSSLFYSSACILKLTNNLQITKEKADAENKIEELDTQTRSLEKTVSELKRKLHNSEEEHQMK